MDFERYIAMLKKTIHIKIMEMYSVMEISSTETAIDEPQSLSASLVEPLYTMLEDKEGYIIVLDMPGADENTIVVNATNNIIRVKCQIREKEYAGSEAGHYRMYEKTIELPGDADVSKLSYWFEKGRLYVRVPRSQ